MLAMNIIKEERNEEFDLLENVILYSIIVIVIRMNTLAKLTYMQRFLALNAIFLLVICMSCIFHFI